MLQEETPSAAFIESASSVSHNPLFFRLRPGKKTQKYTLTPEHAPAYGRKYGARARLKPNHPNHEKTPLALATTVTWTGNGANDTSGKGFLRLKVTQP
jgi:hypothetical protein